MCGNDEANRHFFATIRISLKSEQTKSDNTPYGNEHTQVE